MIQRKQLSGRTVFSVTFFLFIFSISAFLAVGQSEIPSLNILGREHSTREEGSSLAWYDARLLTVEGKGWNDTEGFYERLPARMKDVATPAVWGLSKNTAGINIRFITNSKTIGATWDGGTGMYHMPASGTSGLDMYIRKDSQWEFCGIGRPGASRSMHTIKSGLDGEPHEFMLFLPLYDTVTQLLIGIDEDAWIAPAPPRITKPIVFYGTSITQGGCASRTGMCHTALLCRWLDYEVINLGFSGAGKMELELAELFAELDPVIFVFETLPNMTTEMVRERYEAFMRIIRGKRPHTPIIMTENLLREPDSEQNLALRNIYDTLKADNFEKLYYVLGAPQLKSRENGTVDGIHPTDYGFMSIAEYYEPILKYIIEKHGNTAGN